MDDLTNRAPKWHEDKWGILQGDSHERECRRLAREFNNCETCDRCGAKIFPYENDTLCRFCSEDLQRRGEYPWS